MSGAMLGFPGEDYTTPQTIQRTGGFGNPATRPQRLERFRWALERTRAIGLGDLMLHAGFIPLAIAQVETDKALGIGQTCVGDYPGQSGAGQPSQQFIL